MMTARHDISRFILRILECTEVVLLGSTLQGRCQCCRQGVIRIQVLDFMAWIRAFGGCGHQISAACGVVGPLVSKAARRPCERLYEFSTRFDRLCRLATPSHRAVQRTEHREPDWNSRPRHGKGSRACPRPRGDMLARICQKVTDHACSTLMAFRISLAGDAPAG